MALNRKKPKTTPKKKNVSGKKTLAERTSELQRVNEELEQEIAERTQAEKEVRLMALFAELNPSPVLRFDINGMVLMANPAAVEILNVGTLAGMPLTSVLPGIKKSDLINCISSGKIFSHAAVINDRSFLFTIKGVPDLGFGQLYGSDTTEQKKAEAEIMRASHLAALGELAAGVAHEINNPINGIINYTQILANNSIPGSREQNIARRIIKEGDRIAGIVKSLLSFARDSKDEKRLCYIHEIMSDTLALTETQLKKDGVTLMVNIPAGISGIIAQPNQLEQVFLNIISNSRHALNQKYPGMHSNKILEISTKCFTIKDEPYLRIIFHDHGSGIPAGIMDKIMDPFFTTKPGDLGTGLGLSISHGIISNHGGKITIESVKGEFTKVIIDLPANAR